MKLVYVLMKNCRNDFAGGDWTTDSWPVRVFSSSSKALEYATILLEKDFKSVLAKYGENDVTYRSNIVSYDQDSEQIYYSVEALPLDEEN